MIIKLMHHDAPTQEWEWSGAPTLSEARLIKERTGLTIKGFLEGFQEMDPDAITAMLYVLHRREGKAVAWDDIDCEIGDTPRPGVPALSFEVDEDEQIKVQAAAALAESSGSEGKAPTPPAVVPTPPTTPGVGLGPMSAEVSMASSAPTP
ncbi:hypothetical protein [Nocardiopsis synnemataformans]|uniref:hypothetical protein n=1 Tax=Nocardiopsis synnemataformans TaxID=61305 RepID=UPI003EBC3DE4